MRVLLIADPGRKDTFDYLTTNFNGIEWHFIWNYSDAQKVSREHNHHSWKNYKTPKHLLKTIRPDKIIFLEIIDLWQIPLIIHCKKTRVTTFFLEHGVGNTVEHVTRRFSEDLQPLEKIRLYSKKVRTELGKVFRNRVFYYSALKDVSNTFSFLSILILPLYLKIYTPIQALSKLKFKERTPDYALLFNKNNIAPFLIYNKIASENILTTGVPFFDKYYQEYNPGKEYVVFIEHPYLEEKLLGWDDRFHKKVATALFEFSRKNHLQVIVKLHPRSDINNWARYNFPAENLKLIPGQVPEKVYLEAKLILGYSSTLISAVLCAKKNVVLLGWHPDPFIFGLDYSEMGLCHVSFKVDDLEEKYNEWLTTNLCLNNHKKYDSFIENFNNPFDGLATQRLLEIIKNV